MSAAPEPVGTLEVALAHAARLLAAEPSLAAEQATEILKLVPDHPGAVLVLGTARRALGDAAAAIAVLDPLTRAQPTSAAAHYELGLALGAAGRADDAIAALRQAVRLKPDLSHGWLALGDQLTGAGDAAGADLAYAWHIKTSIRDPRLLAAASALVDNRIPEAEVLLRAHLKMYPTDVAAIRIFAEVAARLRRFADAETLLIRCLALAPRLAAARHNYALVLHRQNKPAAALRELERLFAQEPRNASYESLKAAVLARIGDLSQSIEIYEGVLAAHPLHAKIWMSYGHALKTQGREQDSIAAYRKSIELAPSLGEAYWSLANLKTYRFNAQDVQQMRSQLNDASLATEDRYHLHFAVGKALEDAGSYAASFDSYADGNRIRRASIGYAAEEMTALVRRSRALLTRDFFVSRAGFGAAQPDPIFIVGLPRSGSTLVEQILSSHSQIEGTMELPDLGGIAKTLSGITRKGQASKYPEALATLSAADCRRLGEQYLTQTKIQRKSAAPFFIDKMPNNLSLIHISEPTRQAEISY